MELQHLALRARHAAHYLVADLLFLIGEEHIPVIGHSRQHAGEARAAYALLATRLDLDAVRLERLDDALVCGYDIGTTRARDLYRERVARAG